MTTSPNFAKASLSPSVVVRLLSPESTEGTVLQGPRSRPAGNIRTHDSIALWRN